MVEEVWQLLEQSPGETSSGYLMRRILTDVQYDVFLAIEKPSSMRLMMIRVHCRCAEKGFTTYPASKSFEVKRVLLNEDDKDHVTFQLILKNAKYIDIFTTLVQDIVDHITSIPDQEKAVAAFFTRLRRWQLFLEQHDSVGLSETAQQGLYGELWFLRQAVLPQLGTLRGVLSWSGPRAAQQDFQFSGCAVEVKTAITKQHQKLAISSERQLDNTGTDVLILLHLSLDARQGGGETLPDMVASVRSLVQLSPTAREELENRLFEVGYLDSHASRYGNTGYTIREVNYFKVEGDFPRIIEADLRNGIGDVRYTISVAECKRFSIPETDVLLLLRGQDE